MELEKLDLDLINQAEQIIERNFDSEKYYHTVGAAVRSTNGKVYIGVNLDGIHGSCAEAIALGAAITAGERGFECIVAVYGKDAPHNVLSPCGNCRQLIAEIAPQCNVIIQTGEGYKKVTIAELLPYPCL
ncbi:cytidine deaminase [Paenibacillus sp. PR3]|uniref:Cytidine deaminase n=1 Tax=Paenibacillus terricola TaxID=2763503 RepID=A0ABR8MWP0_9BACL|nr:cytidine deaminase [Paenibacillus terricola]MBD3919320.1 cytidine deaminase [Paenibacillus terricola]